MTKQNNKYLLIIKKIYINKSSNNNNDGDNNNNVKNNKTTTSTSAGVYCTARSKAYDYWNYCAYGRIWAAGVTGVLAYLGYWATGSLLGHCGH